jgi:hypothetical protein
LRAFVAPDNDVLAAHREAQARQPSNGLTLSAIGDASAALRDAEALTRVTYQAQRSHNEGSFLQDGSADQFAFSELVEGEPLLSDLGHRGEELQFDAVA